MNIQISNEQIDVINEMISFYGLEISPEGAILEIVGDGILDVARILDELKELKAKQQQLINRPKLFIVK